ncbi:membrane protein [Streptomyces sp. CNQ-509]|uniref:DUF3017 domain-containing protein n=1 Tax=unclassified Streptomyces TaxID=2593676 RepID=UPI00062DF9C1|nr:MULTISPECIES: DUF3017 domain-containing protein [unclassified Streptomyces]AKH84384.1 membrane protein [Streptomyces sp. CNQ-509]AZM48226.1 DUF3017 domain-containing protein [Streptomyces sp. WAC 06738]
MARRTAFPTRGTVRPEGGGRAASGKAPPPVRQWPILLVLAIAAAGLITVAAGPFREGTLILGGSLLVGGVLRGTVPEVGMLAVRSRFTDIVTFGVLGLAIVLLALVAMPDPWLEVPFLEDAVHFSVR